MSEIKDDVSVRKYLAPREWRKRIQWIGRRRQPWERAARGGRVLLGTMEGAVDDGKVDDWPLPVDLFELQTRPDGDPLTQHTLFATFSQVLTRGR